MGILCFPFFSNLHNMCGKFKERDNEKGLENKKSAAQDHRG